MGESTDSRGQWISSQKSYKIDQNRWYIVLKISELVDGIHASVSRHLVSRFGAAVVSGGLSGRLISSATTSAVRLNRRVPPFQMKGLRRPRLSSGEQDSLGSSEQSELLSVSSKSQVSSPQMGP